MELYVHLPFCTRKCRYCDFASYVGREADMAAYVSALLEEASAAADGLPDARFTTVFLGGGTPSLLPAPLVTELLTGLRDRFDIADDAEFTTEANPGTLTADWLRAAVRGGVNRLSLGMQARQPELLALLGRIHRFEQVVASVDLAREAGLENISLDLMFGLPGQSLIQWQDTLSAALSLRPTHLSCYGLIPEDGTPLKADLDAGRLSLPEEETERAMYDATLARLSAAGFEQYEISNFALPGRACRHNLGYWRQVPYLGLGASAASMLPNRPGCAYLRTANPPALDGYLSMIHDRRWTDREETPVSPRDAQFETMMLGLRTTRGVSEQDFLAMHAVSLDTRYGATLRRLERGGLLAHRDGRWFLTRRGMDVQNAVLVELMDD